MTTHRLSTDDLTRFTGTDNWYRHSLNPRVLYTDGAKHVADAGGAYWLLDTIALSQAERRVAGEEFQVWKLTVREDRSATLVCEDGNGHVVRTETIPFTDFPLDEIALWFANNVICLPSEH